MMSFFILADSVEQNLSVKLLLNQSISRKVCVILIPSDWRC